MRIRIYQINSERDINRVKFFGLDSLKKHQGTDAVDVGIYDEVYEGDVESSMLEGIYKIFNTSHPDGFTGHSLSVSDIVEVITSPGHPSPEPGFYFCDSIGFKKVDFNTVLPQPANRGEILRLNAKTKMGGKLPTIAARDAYLEELWKIFGDVPMNPETECIEEPFFVNPCDNTLGYDCFPKGTSREEIWHWFDERHSRGVSYLLYHSDVYLEKGLTRDLMTMANACQECMSECCIFNPDGMCLFPIIGKRCPNITDDGCSDCIPKDFAPELCPPFSQKPGELSIDLGFVTITANIDEGHIARRQKDDGKEEFMEIPAMYISAVGKDGNVVQDLVCVHAADPNEYPDGAFDVEVWRDEMDEAPDWKTVINMYHEPETVEDA